ncbi:hypothetical protein RDV89_17510 [Nocardioides zeae]|uniref:Sigma-70 family RNA polymerase sigma factor n=1 Tax=Nocardioides imazamoxiresistens TaxID=3231893 RepID=A0ABU3Q054_9ACTN|nr:hypothetical protein [Nocardioides zeae]MDT9594890.1 hypothetical protein [Nocardioides zeae]
MPRQRTPSLRTTSNWFNPSTHPLLARLPEHLDRTDAWSRWTNLDSRLAAFADLDNLLQYDSASPARYGAVAALVGIASRRGHDDDDAALAVVAVLANGVGATAYRLRDRCGLDDVIATTWERAKTAEPNPGPRAADFLLRRVHAQLVAETASLVADRDAESLEQLEFDIAELGEWDETFFDEPIADVVDLLAWAKAQQILRPLELAVLTELLDLERAGMRRAERNEIVASRAGISSRTVFRVEARAIAALRSAVEVSEELNSGWAA